MGPPRCLCEICSCGRHRCCHKRTKIYDDGLPPSHRTEYVDNYPGYGNICPPSSCKPKPEFQQHRGKMDGISIFKTDYLPYDVVKRPFRAPAEYRPKSGKIDLGTIYQRDYNPHKVGPVTLARPRERKHTTDAKLDTIPTYRDDYRLWEAQRTESCKVEQTYQPPTERFGNPSTFQDDYIPREPNPPESFKPSAAKLPDGPFDGNTIHRTAYVVHEMEPRFVRPKEEYKPCDQPFEDLTTHQRDFKGIPGQQAKSCKPEHRKVGSDAPFNGTTEFQDRYQPVLVSLPEFRKPREYVPPTDKMDLNSTNRLDYISHKISPAAPIRPPHGRRISAPFQGNTTTREDFKPWSICPRGLIKKEQEIPRPTGKFADLTTFRSHYIPLQGTPAQSCKPVHAVGLNAVPFQDETLYRIDYTPKKTEICPAHHPSNLGYVYVNTDSQGHQFFRRLSPEPSEPNCNPIPNEVAVT
ncbi:PREDICTED: stabilizer of axonemal microtubules 2 [Lepidothrix coronata]|uniref:Stabilizer of axonemal microtubules 2 n=1 Tax=Lepidothrix coronata TaxID=321398 RepID=A0A6J0GGC7_9PASS|nr:PREDICTED: stabilizer of axonemal microtubules 2 [Lepidothrix coronata]